MTRHNGYSALHMVASQVIQDSMHRHNQRFISRAMRQWDIDGQGCFADYVRHYVSLCWLSMVMWN